MCKGSAFQKVMRLDTEKLKHNSTDGVKLIVQALGGVWGQTTLETKYEKFEKAVFTLAQKNDESNSSYIARHEVLYEELVSQGVTFTDLRAYLLLRNSSLSSEDKKRVIVESKGDLKYDSVVSAIKMLGAKFFHDVQGQQKTYKSKTYDVNFTQDGDDEPTGNDEYPMFLTTEAGDITDAVVDHLIAEGDEDALIVSQFEDALIDSLQNDSEMSTYVSTYLEARHKLSEKAKFRGFWPVKGKGSGKKGGKGKGQRPPFKARKPLAVRIAESECRICHQQGHWKWECPKRFQAGNSAASSSPPKTQTANVMIPVAEDASDDEADVFVVNVHNPDDENDVPDLMPVQDIGVNQLKSLEHTILACTTQKNVGDKSRHPIYDQVRKAMSSHVRSAESCHLPSRTSPGEMYRKMQTPSVRVPMTGPPVSCSQQPPTGADSVDACPAKTVQPKVVNTRSTCDVNFATTQASGILDLGASQSVMGEHQLEDFLNNLPPCIRDKVFEQPVHMSFRFGNNSTVPCNRAMFIPVDRYWLKIAIVPSRTPFLISNNVCRSLGAVIDTADRTIFFKTLGCMLPLTLSSKRLFLLDLSELILLRPPKTAAEKPKVSAENVFACQELSTPGIKVSQVLSKSPIPESRSPTMSEATNAVDSRQRHSDSSPSTVTSTVDCSANSSRSNVDDRSCQPLCSSPDQRDSPTGRSQVSSHEHGTVAASDNQVRNCQARTDLSPSDSGRSQVLHLVSQDLVSEQEVRAQGVPALHANVDRAQGAGSLGPDTSIIPSIDAQGPSSPSSRDPHRAPGSSGRGRAIRTMGGLEQPVQCRAEQPSAPGATGDHHGRSCEPAPCSDSPARKLASPSEAFFLDKCIQEVNQYLSNMIVPDEDYLLNAQKSNWVLKEMEQYFQEHGSDLWASQVPGIDLLEVYCSSESQLTHQSLKQNLRAMRFGLREGDLRYFEGRCKLYDILIKYRPRSIWLSPKCKAWCKWNQFNAARSPISAEKVQRAREEDSVHLLLCDALFQLQVCRGSQFHTHLEQPIGSDMLFQEELHTLLEHSLRTRCDQCAAGQLKHPESGMLIQKGTQILTTSKIMAQYISSFRCPRNHQHAQIAGNFKNKDGKGEPLSSYTELYTASFGHKIAKTLAAIRQVKEPSVAVSEHVFHEHSLEGAEEPDPKRRRVTGKSPTPPAFVDSASSNSGVVDSSADVPQDSKTQDIETCYPDILQKASQIAPRVGKLVLEHGDTFDMIQNACPGHQVRVVELCKGTDRFRAPPIKLAAGEAPLRCTFGTHRPSLEPTEFWSWVSWEKMSNRQMKAKSPPTRLLVTVFARSIDEHNNKRQNTETAQEDISNKRTKLSTLEDQPTDSANIPKHITDNEVTETTQSQPIQYQPHGPKFKALDKKTQQWISKIHHNLGHPNHKKLQAVLQRQGYDEKILQGVSDFQCSTCHELQLPKISRPAHLSEPREFNQCVGCDLVTWTNSKGKNFQFLHFIDVATNFQVAQPVYRTDAEALFDAFQNCWMNWAGPCQQLIIDNETALCSDLFASMMQRCNTHLRVVAAYAHWQMGKTERHGDILQHMLQKLDHELPIDNDDQFRTALGQCCNAKNSLSRVRGYTPEILVLGKSTHLPGTLCDDEFPQPAQYLADSETSEGLLFRKSLQYRECARKAFIDADHSEQLRRAFLRRQRPHRGQFSGGTFVMFWRPGRGENPGQWHGPARIIIQESQHVIWLSHSSRVYRVAPEHIRLLSEKEAQDASQQIAEGSPLPPLKEAGRGVFQFEDLTEQVVRTPSMMPPAPPNIPQASNESNQSEQPDSEPQIHIPTDDNNTDSYAPTTPISDTPIVPNPEDVQPENIPVPDSEDDELMLEDYWIHQGNQLMRIHRKPRNDAFDPSTTNDCPVNILMVSGERSTTGNFGDSPVWAKQDEWGHDDHHWTTPRPWTGVTVFAVLDENPEEAQTLTQDDILHLEENQALEYTIFFTQDDLHAIAEKPTELLALAASAAKRQRAEVKLKDLKPQELAEFQSAKGKEIDQWLSTETVRKILRNKIPEQNILRCRWVLTWKDLDPVDAEKEGKSRKAKARLVILGYEDPNICDIPRDSPTLQKESRSLLLQMCAARRLTIRSFDIKTAFLRGSRRDNRILGVDPPPELRDRLQLKDEEICELLKSAYGLVNAPYLWYQELKEMLVSLGFTISPLDPCLFVLADESGFVHGALGVHVDDGLCFGDKIFDTVIQQLEARFPFGSKREKEFTFTGLHLRQDEYYNIHIDQTEYVMAIEPIQIDRHRRKDENQVVLENERQQLRAVIGSLQYAATNTRPDVAARLSFLQSKINCATISDLLEANRLLGDTKRHAEVGVTISCIDEDAIRIVSYSDASFASRAKQQSQKGGLFLAVHSDVFLQKSALASPLTWYSKKIDRVVASTLAAETYALSSAVDMTDWIRLMWAWLRNPTVPWKDPERVWQMEPPSIAVVDCKSLYDVITKNTTPQCQEHRTLVEALVIKHHIQHGIKPHWVHSAAQLADCLTKAMDCFRIREFLTHRTCCLHDVEEVLKQRADRKAQKTWLSNAANRHQSPPATSLGVESDL